MKECVNRHFIQYPLDNKSLPFYLFLVINVVHTFYTFTTHKSAVNVFAVSFYRIAFKVVQATYRRCMHYSCIITKNK